MMPAHCTSIVGWKVVANARSEKVSSLSSFFKVGVTEFVCVCIYGSYFEASPERGDGLPKLTLSKELVHRIG